MDLSHLLLSIAPLVLFVIVDAVWGQNQGIKAALIAAALEIVFSLIYFKTIDEFSIASGTLVLVFAGLSHWKKDSIHLKFQPVVLAGILGLFFVISYWLGKPILLLMLEKYSDVLPLQMRGNLGSPIFRLVMKEMSHYIGYGFLIHGAFIAYAAKYMSNWWWLTIRIGGQYIMMFACYFFTLSMVKSSFS